MAGVPTFYALTAVPRAHKRGYWPGPGIRTRDPAQLQKDGARGAPTTPYASSCWLNRELMHGDDRKKVRGERLRMGLAHESSVFEAVRNLCLGRGSFERLEYGLTLLLAIRHDARTHADDDEENAGNDESMITARPHVGRPCLPEGSTAQ